MNSNSVKLLKVFFEVGYCNFALGASIKDVQGQGERGFNANILRTRGGSSDADVRTFWCKNSVFF